MATKTSSFWFVVPAAGIGQRMASDRPKQYLSLLNSSILEHTLTTLLSVEGVQGVVVALHPDDKYWPELAVASHPQIHTVIGGEERADSVLSALNYLQSLTEAEDWVLVHDAARPCVTPQQIKRLFESLMDDEVGGILALPASDTLKQVHNQQIEKTLDRSIVWQAQTPQMFRIGLLKKALENSADDKSITDEASALEKEGLTVNIIEGSRDNIKVTHQDDLWLAEAILARHQTMH